MTRNVDARVKTWLSIGVWNFGLSSCSSSLEVLKPVQISEFFFQLYIADFCQISESFAKSVNFKYEMVKKDCSFSQNSLRNGLFMECNS